MHSKEFGLILVLGILSYVTAMATSNKANYIGFDLGTSGARISVIEHSGTSYEEVHSDATLYSEYDDPTSWTDSIHSLLKNTPKSLLSSTQAICISGTSASCLLVDPIGGKVTRPAKMYDYDITHKRGGINPAAAIEVTRWIDKYAPANHATRASTSALSKLLHYHACQSIHSREVLAHQSEYVATSIFLSNPKKCGTSNNKRIYTSDWHNALKLGYDVRELRYPDWLFALLEEVGIDATTRVLPEVNEPGKVIDKISSAITKQYGLNKDAVIVGGTTDSNAAFLAATANGGTAPTYGIAVTSLGSTLAMKMLSRTFVEDSSTGVYSHRFPILAPKSSTCGEEEAWLVGGASNVGCAILRQENFSNDELVKLSKDMDTSVDSPLDYYPLTKVGERFPVADGKKKPVLTPKPECRSEYLKAILQGISNVERMGFEILGELGASPSFPENVWTAGGGSRNESWIKMRERLLQERFQNDKISVGRAVNAEASFGAAILAASTFV